MAAAEHGFNNLPVGFRFDPNDDLLVNYFLKKKICGEPLPPHGLLDIDVLEAEPWMLPGDKYSMKDRKYYFSDVSDRSEDTKVAGKGYWKIVEKNREIVLPSDHFVGKKNTYVYWKMQGTRTILSKWVMHEFHITTNVAEPTKVSFIGAYRIFKGKVDYGRGAVTAATVIDLKVENEGVSVRPPSP